MAESNLARLFNYAKAGNSSPVENFTTEALAAAIREDPSPMLRALSDRGVTIDAACEPRTQVPVARDPSGEVQGGQIDLLLVGDGCEVCVEVKVDSGPSGDQFKTYLNWRAKRSGRRVVALAKEPEKVAPDDSVTELSWQQLWTHARTSQCLYWRDLCQWLEEKNMVDDSYQPVTDADLHGVEGAHRLVRKTTRILEAVVATVASERWLSVEDVAGHVWRRFREHRSPSIELKLSDASGVSVGILDAQQGGADPTVQLGVWLWADPRKADDARGLREACATLATDVWVLAPTTWVLCRASRPVTSFDQQAGAVTWLIVLLNGLLRRLRAPVQSH